MNDLINTDSLFTELSILIDKTHKQIINYANSSLVVLFWHVGQKINNDVLLNERAEYGQRIVSTLSTQLTEKYGRNFSLRNLRRMMQFANEVPSLENDDSIFIHLSWSHIVELLPLKNMDSKKFYANLVFESKLSVRELRKNIETKVFERTQIANIQAKNSSTLPLNTFKEPYLLDFLNLPLGYLERDLELAILQELEQFILELGKGFAFVERQKRMIIDGEDFYLDLLFFHRKLKRLVAIELKVGKFKAQDKGQMELYLNWLNKYERQEGEESPIGLILCAENSKEQVELLQLSQSGILVAEYWTELPSKELLEQQLHKSLIEAKERLAITKQLDEN